MNRFLDQTAAAVIAALGLAAAGGCNSDPGNPPKTPLYRRNPDEGPTSGERGKVTINEINFAGSVTNDGTHRWDDLFIELQNKSERPVNLTGWRFLVRGDVDETYRIPPSDPVPPNGYFVIVRQPDGAFGKVADAVIEDLELGRKHLFMQLLDRDKRRVTVIGSHEQRVFAGGWDTVSVRSMERTPLLFANSGTASRSWHTYSSREGLKTIREGYRKYTLASPGRANSTDYSGSTASGDFE
ncbi:MAG: lamin tail domain-containing protein [Bradymonadaceae bacterium]